MADLLRWQVEEKTLYLRGKLDRETLSELWQQRETAVKDITVIDVGGLQRVDSAGLALLVHLRQIALAQGASPVFCGITDKLHSLIALYNLQQIIVSAENPA